MKIDLLEDDFSLGGNIRDFLELQGYEVKLYRDGLSFLETSTFDADLYILDIEVPQANGYEVIEWIRRNQNDAPVIFTTAYTDIDSIKKSYGLGCNDYLKKPYDLFELKLRIEKLLPQSQDAKIELDEGVAFDMSQKQLFDLHNSVKLSKTQKEILYTLLRHKNRLVTYEMLIEAVWENSFVKINTIATHLKEIRKALPKLDIESIRAEGYLLHLS